jgi:SseB protein N-terminal domain/SseB protein C-terminal domain
VTNELLDAMRRASETDDPDARRGIYRAFAQAEVLVPTRGADGGSELVAVEARDGSPVALAFTDVDAFANWAEADASWGSLRGSDLCALVLEQGGTAVIVNPHGPFGGQLGRRELELVADSGALDVEQVDGAVATLAVRDPSQLELRPAASVPNRILDAVSDAARPIDGITSVYVIEVTGPSGTRFALGVEHAADADWDHVAQALGRRLSEHLPADDSLDLYALSPEQLAALERSAAPAYRRA